MERPLHGEYFRVCKFMLLINYISPVKHVVKLCAAFWWRILIWNLVTLPFCAAQLTEVTERWDTWHSCYNMQYSCIKILNNLASNINQWNRDDNWTNRYGIIEQDHFWQAIAGGLKCFPFKIFFNYLYRRFMQKCHLAKRYLVGSLWSCFPRLGDTGTATHFLISELRQGLSSVLTSTIQSISKRGHPCNAVCNGTASYMYIRVYLPRCSTKL